MCQFLSAIVMMLGSSQVGEMYESSIVKKLYDRARLPEGKEPLEDKR